MQQARVMSLGFKLALADWYWVQALHYFTDPWNAYNQYKNLGNFLDLVVGLDPDYEYAYKFAGISLPYDTGRLHFVNTRKSTWFLEEGERRFPNNWQFPFYLGYNYLNFHNEKQKAAEAYARAAKIPGSPKYLAAFAAKLFALGGSEDQALLFAESALEETEDPETRAMLENRIADIKQEKVLQAIEKAAADFKQAEGRYPNDLAELVSRGFPHPGGQYSLDEQGVAHSPLRPNRLQIYKDDTSGMVGEPLTPDPRAGGK
ncbi:MAG: hypothetical protein U0228_25735 [Myxococcaceae bacterium]